MFRKIKVLLRHLQLLWVWILRSVQQKANGMRGDNLPAFSSRFLKLYFFSLSRSRLRVPGHLEAGLCLDWDMTVSPLWGTGWRQPWGRDRQGHQLSLSWGHGVCSRCPSPHQVQRALTDPTFPHLLFYACSLSLDLWCARRRRTFGAEEATILKTS